MKKLKFLPLGVLAASLLFVSCDDDDDGSFGGSNSTDGLYATSNTTGNVYKLNFDLSQDEVVKSFMTASSDAEGIYFDDEEDQVTQVSRTLMGLTTYTLEGDTEDGTDLADVAESSTDLQSPRDLAVLGNMYVVADNADVDGDDSTQDGRFYIYTKSGNSFTLRNTVTVDFAVWGIDFIDNDLYAVADKTSDIVMFSDFLTMNTTDATVQPDKRISIEGITRTHGLDFEDDVMVLTDIGDAASDSDGALHVIVDFTSKFAAVENGGTLMIEGNQVRISGSSTLLGNPVNVIYDEDDDVIYVAERANGGGQVLVFSDFGNGGDVTPRSEIVPGVSSLHLID